jgi:hypothetical protein
VLVTSLKGDICLYTIIIEIIGRRKIIIIIKTGRSSIEKIIREIIVIMKVGIKTAIPTMNPYRDIFSSLT